MPSPPILATTWRGDTAEVVVRGHVAVVDANGAMVASVGDPQVQVTLRSCVKPIQAQPFVAQAADQLRVTQAEVAIACASHMGEEDHVRTVRQLLTRVGLTEMALECGPQMPMDAAAARELLVSGGGPRPIYNNCSGKHAAMLATCVVAGWPIDGYIDPEHPCQRAVGTALSRLLDVDLDNAPHGIDGCGLPTYAVPLAALARSFAAGQQEAGFRRCQNAMAENPHLVAGSGRFDTDLLADAGDVLTAKIGGAAVWAAAIRPDGPGVAIKLEAGLGEAIPPVALAVLRCLEALPPELSASLLEHVEPPLRNWAGDVVGVTLVNESAYAPLSNMNAAP